MVLEVASNDFGVITYVPRIARKRKTCLDKLMMDFKKSQLYKVNELSPSPGIGESDFNP